MVKLALTRPRSSVTTSLIVCPACFLTNSRSLAAASWTFSTSTDMLASMSSMSFCCPASAGLGEGGGCCPPPPPLSATPSSSTSLDVVFLVTLATSTLSAW